MGAFSIKKRKESITNFLSWNDLWSMVYLN